MMRGGIRFAYVYGGRKSRRSFNSFHLPTRRLRLACGSRYIGSSRLLFQTRTLFGLPSLVFKRFGHDLFSEALRSYKRSKIPQKMRRPRPDPELHGKLARPPADWIPLDPPVRLSVRSPARPSVRRSARPPPGSRQTRPSVCSPADSFRPIPSGPARRPACPMAYY